MADVKVLKSQGEYLFGKKRTLDDLWQQIADNFYPERAWFTVSRDPGEEFASHLMTGYPVMARRDLANAIGSMLRRDKWFRIVARDEDEQKNLNIESQRWLEWATQRQFKLMHDPQTMWVTAAKQADNDFVAFGQAVLSVEVYQYSHLLFRCWHLKDCAWSTNDRGKIDTMHIKYKLPARSICSKFRDGAHQKCRDLVSQGKIFEEIDCQWIVTPNLEKGGYTSVHLDGRHDHVMEKKDIPLFPFVVPRWQLVSESQYAYSPAVVAGLPDARLLQAMTLTLLEAGEMSVRPPMLAVQEAIRSDVQLVAGGITWTDAQYDERLGEVLRPLAQDRGGFPAAFRIEETVRLGIADAFFLNKLNLPITGDMTAYEVQQRVQEFVRNTLPLFQPLEYEYNAAVCELVFEILMRYRAFGTELPEQLQGRDIAFRFESPLQAATDREKVEQFRATIEMVRASVEIDPNVVHVPKFDVALREAMQGLGAPATWLRTEEEADEAIEASQQRQREMEDNAQAIEAMKAMPKQPQGMPM